MLVEHCSWDYREPTRLAHFYSCCVTCPTRALELKLGLGTREFEVGAASSFALRVHSECVGSVWKRSAKDRGYLNFVQDVMEILSSNGAVGMF